MWPDVFYSLWDRSSKLFPMVEGAMRDSLAAPMGVSAGIIMAIFWGYAVYKIFEIVQEARGTGDGLIMGVFQRARKPMIVYVLMFVMPVLASALGGMAISHTKKAHKILVEDIGETLHAVDGYIQRDGLAAAHSFRTDVERLMGTSGNDGGAGEVIAALRAASPSSPLAPAQLEAAEALGNRLRARATSMSQKIQSDSVALATTVGGLTGGSKDGYYNANSDVAKHFAKRPARNIEAQVTTLVSKDVADAQKNIKALEQSAKEIADQVARIKADKGYKEPEGSGMFPTAEEIANAIGGKLASMFTTPIAATIAFVFWVIGALAAVMAGIAIFKAGMDVVMYVMGFMAMVLVGTTMAVPLAPAFMLCLISDKTESYGQGYIRFFLSMVFAAAGVEAMATMAARATYLIVSVGVHLSSFGGGMAESFPALFLVALKMGASIFAVGFVANFMLGLVKRGASLGAGIYGGSFPS